MKTTHTIEAGCGFGSCYPRRDTVMTVEFESGAKTLPALKGQATKAFVRAFRERFGKDARDYGIVLWRLDGNELH